MVTDASSLPPVFPKCPICHNLAESALEERIELDLHDNKAFAESATTKCLACRTIRGGVLSFVRSTTYFSHVTLSLRYTTESQNWQTKGRLIPELVVQVLRTNWDWKLDDTRPLWDDSTGGGINLQFFSLPGDRSPWKVLPEYPEPSLDSTSDPAIATIRDWLGACISKHSKCSPNDTEMPTRVLFVGDNNHPPRLVATEGKHGRYTALTWCWGTEPTLRTTEISLHDHEREIPWSHLPFLFRDAALITRKLGIDYLWIDALCIIQDSDDDWIREASKMTQVYGNAHLTIAADACHNAFHSLSGNGPFRNLFISNRNLELGFHGDGHLRNLLRSKFSMPCCTSAGIASVKVRIEPQQDASGCHGGLFAAQSSLKTRGWCLQEHMLSRRILHFGAVEMSWQCVDMEACECQREASTAGTSTSRIEMANVRKSFLESNAQASCRTWLSIVEEFTSRNLTKQKDRLPALEGLAKLMARCFASTLDIGPEFQNLRLAGMWRSWLAVELAWFVKPPSRISKLNGAPKESNRISSTCTWSWASVTGAVMFPEGPQFDVLSASQSSSRVSDRKSDLPQGTILVRGRLWRNVNLNLQLNSDTTKRNINWYPECPMYKAESRQFRNDDPRHLPNRMDHIVFLDVWNEIDGSDHGYCALEPSQGSGWAILLRETPQDHNGATAHATFQRVGMICHTEIVFSPSWAEGKKKFGGPDIEEQTVNLV